MISTLITKVINKPVSNLKHLKIKWSSKEEYDWDGMKDYNLKTENQLYINHVKTWPYRICTELATVSNIEWRRSVWQHLKTIC
jgi:hypothetical protein